MYKHGNVLIRDYIKSGLESHNGCQFGGKPLGTHKTVLLWEAEGPAVLPFFVKVPFFVF